MRVEQVKVGPMANFAYVLVGASGEGALVDPAWDVDALLARADALGVRVTHVLVTHGHHDHVNGLEEARRRTGARVVAHASSDVPHDEPVAQGTRLRVGGADIDVVHTPGHRFDSVCYVVEGTHILTGDTLFVGECGRVDLPGSDVDAMRVSLLETLAALPEDLVVCPGHDYGKTPTSTLRQERETNYTLQPRDPDAFRRFMAQP